MIEELGRVAFSSTNGAFVWFWGLTHGERAASLEGLSQTQDGRLWGAEIIQGRKTGRVWHSNYFQAFIFQRED